MKINNTTQVMLYRFFAPLNHHLRELLGVDALPWEIKRKDGSYRSKGTIPVQDVNTTLSSIEEELTRELSIEPNIRNLTSLLQLP
jgi:hypothetical protein